MKATAMHWGLFFGLLLVAVAGGFVLGNHYLDKVEQKRLESGTAQAG